MHKVLQPKWQPGDRATTKESHTIVPWWYFPIIWSELRFWNLTVCHFTKNTFLPSEANSPSVPSLYCWLGEDQVIVFLSPLCGHTDILNMWKRFMWKMYTFSSAYMWRKEKLAKLEFFCTSKCCYWRLIFNFHFVFKGPVPYMETQAHFHSLDFVWQIFKSELRQS